jgi:NNP family nitrate/nitrite transporter-like MFS transporter
LYISLSKILIWSYYILLQVGTANGVVGGWGNLGGGVTQLFVGSGLYPLFQLFWPNESEERASELAWRTVCIVPASLAVVTGIVIYKISDDAPKGNCRDLRKEKNKSPTTNNINDGITPPTTKDVNALSAFVAGTRDINSWILFLHYACSFGVELTMYNASSLYYTSRFGLSTSSAAAVSSIFGWMNLFTRATGGMMSDYLNKKMGMRGRLITQVVLLLFEAVSILIFAQTSSLASSIVVMIFFSAFVQAAEGKMLCLKFHRK